MSQATTAEQQPAFTPVQQEAIQLAFNAISELYELVVKLQTTVEDQNDVIVGLSTEISDLHQQNASPA